ncbi:MAG: hypothetical protein ACAI44_03970 [Candidatus Sericytochromatia bacterium]
MVSSKSGSFLKSALLSLSFSLSLGLTGCNVDELRSQPTTAQHPVVAASVVPPRQQPVKESQAPVKAVSSPKVQSLEDADEADEGDQDSEMEEEDCLVQETASRRFLPITSRPPGGRILPATENECGFYNWSLQTFLYVSQPDQDGTPAFAGFEAPEKVFGLKSAADHSVLTLNGGFRQAGDLGAILVDQNHNPIFFSIHINDVFANFIKKNGLNQLTSMLQAPEAGGVSANLEFPPGAVELKAAWKILAPGEDASDYFTLQARVPLLKNVGAQVVDTGQTREATVALLSLHVVGVVQDHPEFIWATFEHVDAEGRRDIAPAASENPDAAQPQQVDATQVAYPLYGHGAGTANILPLQRFDEASQTFADATSVFRVFPASSSEQSEEDEEVLTLNQQLSELFARSDPMGRDPRRHYRMVGAVWIDQPGADSPAGIFKAERSFENSETDKILAGEDRLSSMAMESFTQQTSFNCLSCHNTLSKSLGNDRFLPPRRVNVSNVLTYYLRKSLETPQD